MLNRKGLVILRNDKFQLEINPERQEIRFYPLQIELGEIVRRKVPSFTLRRRDFKLHPDEWQTLVEWLSLWS